MTITAGAAKTAARAAIDSAFGPIPSGLKPAEQTAIDTARDQLAESMASQATYVQGAAVVPSGIAVQVAPMSGTGATTAPGSLT
jgi:hypothetical protein